MPVDINRMDTIHTAALMLRITAIRLAIANGTYETAERLDIATARLLADLDRPDPREDGERWDTGAE